jgi:hypothetical protein
MDFDLLGRDFDCLEKTCLGKTKDGPDPQEEEAPPEDGRRLPDALPEVKQAGWLRRDLGWLPGIEPRAAESS